MDIKKENLRESYLEGVKNNNWDKFIKECYEIASFILVKKFPNLPKQDRENYKQELVLKTWELIKDNKINENSNIFSYLIQRYIFMLRDEIRKINRRKKIADVVSITEKMVI